MFVFLHLPCHFEPSAKVSDKKLYLEPLHDNIGYSRKKYLFFLVI